MSSPLRRNSCPSGFPDDPLALLDAHQLAGLLRCSVRHVHRLVRAGHLPQPLRLGTAVRWRRGAINAWLEAGCPESSRAGTLR